MNIINLRETKGDDYSVFVFENAEDGTELMFRLRVGHATLKNMTQDKTLLSGPMNGFDGLCTFIDAQVWAEKNGISLNLLV